MTSITKIEANTPTLKKIRTAAYARVSTSSDEQLLSLEVQKAHYEEYIKSNPEWEFAGLYYDEGISGTKTEKREALLRLLSDCDNGRIDRVITKSISRFSRNTTDCLEMVRRLSKLNISIYFEKENIDTAHMSSELMLSILSSIAEAESRSISENTKWSIKHRYENGTFIISTPPYGYKNDNGKMVVVPEEAEVVKDIFNMCLSGMGGHLIADELNRRGIPSKRSALWHASSIIDMLRNEKYTGDVLYQKTWTDESYNRHDNNGEKGQYICQNHHEAIISHEEFEKAQSAMLQRGREKGSEPGSGKCLQRYAFSGKIVCSECGATLKRSIRYNTGGQYVIWVCNTHINDKSACGLKYINDDDIKDAFARMIEKLCTAHDVVLKPFIHSLHGYDNKEKLHSLQSFESRIEETSEHLKTIAGLFASGYIEGDIYYKEKSELERKREGLIKEKESISSTLSGDLRHLEEAEKLVRTLSKDENFAYTDELFINHVDTITVISRTRVAFSLKCGLKIEERLGDL